MESAASVVVVTKKKIPFANAVHVIELWLANPVHTHYRYILELQTPTFHSFHYSPVMFSFVGYGSLGDSNYRVV
jgi:hypothetical protein